MRAGYRRSRIARHLWKTTALTTLALGLSGLAAHGDPNGLWQPQIRAIIGADNNGGNAALEGFIPLKQTAESVLFLDVRAKHDFKDSFGQDVGLGIRRIVNPDLMIGGYAYLNVENYNSNQFTSATLGAEAITSHFDAHVNVYLPIKGDSTDHSTSSTLSMVSNQLMEQISVLDHRDYAAWGIEGEIGAQVPVNLPDKHSLRLDIGGYHFEDPHGDDGSVTGAKAGFEYTIGDVFGSGTELVFAGEVRNDNRDDTQFAGSVRLNIPFNPGHGSDTTGAIGGADPVYPVSEGLGKRVNERVRGDIGVRIQSQTLSGGSTTRVAINAATNAAFGKFYFADGGLAGAGTQADPTTLDDAVTKAGSGGFVVALGGNGNLTTGGVTLANGQTVIGGGESVTAKLFGGGTGTFNLGGSDGTIQGTNVANPVIALGNGNTLNGITITGGNDGIFGNNITGATLTNVTVTGAGGNGADFKGTSTGITGSNFTATGNGLDGLHIEGDGTYNFTGTTLLQDNLDDGLDITGKGTYTFAIVNAKDNTDRGITVQGTSTGGTFTTTGGAISGNGGIGVFIDPITAHVVLDSISQTGGPAGVLLDHVSGDFTVNGTTTISNTTGPAIQITDSPAAIRFGGDVTIQAPTSGGIDVSGINGKIGFGNVYISGLTSGNTGLDLSGSTSIFTATLLNIAGAGTSTGIDLSGANGGSVAIGSGTISVGTGVQLGTNGASGTSANTAFSFGGGAITGTVASLDARGLNQTLGTYAFGTTDLVGPQLFDPQNVIFIGSSATGSGDGSSLANLAAVSTADGITDSDAIFVLVNDGTAIDATGGFSLSAGQTLASFGNGRTFSLGGIPVNVTGDNVVHDAAISDSGGAATLTDTGSGNTVTLANNSSLLDFTVSNTGGGIGVHGNNVTGVTLTGLTVDGADLNGLLFEGTNAVTATDLTSTHNGGTGLSIQGDGIYTFNGTTELANNATGLSINGDGTYAFQTLNATGNGLYGISAISTGSGTLSTTGGMVSGSGVGSFSATNIGLDVTLTSVAQAAGDTGISLSGVDGNFTVSGATTISNTFFDGILIANSSADVHFGGAVSITHPGGNGIALNGNSGAVTFGDVAIDQPTQNGIDVSGTNGTIGFGNIDITGLHTGKTGLDLSGSQSTFTATSLDITGAGSSTGIDLSGTTGGSVTIGTGVISADTGVQMGTHGAAGTTANTAFSFGAAGGASITGTTASLDMRGLSPGSGTYAFNTTVLNGPQLFDVANVIYVGATSTNAGDGSTVNDLINATAADALAAPANTIFVLVNTGAGSIDTDADGFTLADGQSIVSFANGASVDLGSPPANVTGLNVISGTQVQDDPFGNGGATLNNAAGNTIDLADGNVIENLAVSSSGFAIDGSGSAGATINGVTISAATIGLWLDGTTGTVTANNLTIQSASQTGIALVNSSATLNFTGNTKISGATSVGLFANDLDGTASFDDLDITGGGYGISIRNSSTGTLTFGAGSSITNTGNAAFDVVNSSSNVTYSGTINQATAASAVKISGMTGGTAAFAGKITANTGAAAAIDLSGNTGATINFTGGLDLTTDGGFGFSAINGGTLTVTGSGNTVTTGLGPDEKGIQIGGTGMTIGAAGLNFSSVTVDGSGGGVSTGIVIQNTSGGDVTFGGVDLSRISGVAIRLNNIASGTYSFNGTTTIATVGGPGPGFVVQNSAATINVNNLVTTSVSGADVSLTNNTGTIAIGGTITNSGTGDGVVVSGGSAAITVSAAISSSATAPGTAVKVDGLTGGSVTFSGDVTSTSDGNLFDIGSTTAPSGGTITFSGDLTATGGGAAIVNGMGAAATLNVNGPLSVTNGLNGGLLLSNIAGHATFDGNVTVTGNNPAIVELKNTSGTIALNGSTLVNASGGSSAVSFSGTTSGTISFTDLDIALSSAGDTGLFFVNSIVNGTITATDFDLTSVSSTGTTAVNLSNTTGTGTIQLGDPGAPGNTTGSTIGGIGAGPGIGFQFSSTTAVNFIYGDGEGSVDKLSTVKAVDVLNSTGAFPVGGTYNFSDVDGAGGGFDGDLSEAQGPTTYYVDQDGDGDGTAANPGSIEDAEASGADVIILVDTSQNGTSNLIDMMQAQQVGGGNNTLNLADGQILIGLKAGDSIDTAPLGALGGGLGGNFSFSGINATTVITASSNVDTVLATLTTASGNTVDFSGKTSIDNVILQNTGSGLGLSGTNITDLILSRATIRGGAGGALSLTDGAANSKIALSNLILSATGGDIASVDGSVGAGLMKVSAFSDITLLGNNGEVGGFAVKDVTFDANAATVGIDQVDGGAFVAGTTTNRVGGYGLFLGSVAGDLNFDTTNVAVKAAASGAFALPSAIGIYASGAGGGTSIDFGTASLDVDGNGATVGYNDALFAQIGAGNRVGFSGAVTVNTVKAAGLLSDTGGTLFFGAAGNTITTTGQPAISFAGGTRIENGSGGSAQFGAISAIGGGQNGIYISNIAASPALLFNGPVTIEGTTLNAIQIEQSALTNAASVTFGGAVTITNASQGGVKWQRLAGSTDTLTFSGGLSIQNSNGAGFFADGGAVALSGTNTVSTTNGTGVSISNAQVSGGFSSVSAIVSGAANGINLQNLTGTLALGTGTLINAGSGAAFNVGSGTDLSGGNATISYAGAIVSNGSGAAVSIQELTGGSVTLSGNLTDPNAAGGGQIVVANINNGTAATVTFSGTTKQIQSGATDGVNLVGNINGTIGFSNGGLAISTTSGIGFHAQGGGTIGVAGTTNTITSTGSALSLDAVTVGSGINFNSVSTSGAVTGIGLTNVASAGGAINLGTVNLQGVNSRGVDVTGTLGARLNFNTLSIGLTSTTAVAFDLNGAIINAPITANDFDVTNSAGAGTSIGVDLRGATGGQIVRLGDAVVGGASSSISGVNTGVFLDSATNLAFTYGDGETATDQNSTIGATVGIDASSAPGAGTYNFQDVNFTTNPGNGFGLGKIYFVDSDGATGGGDGSGKDSGNPMTLAAAEAAAGVNDIIVLINNGNAITAFSTNADNTLNLQTGEQVRGFGNGDINLALTVPLPIQLASNSIAIAQVGAGAATLTTTDGNNVIATSASGNIIDGFILDGDDGAGVNAARGIAGSGGSNTTVSHMTIRNFSLYGADLGAGAVVDAVTFNGNGFDLLAGDGTFSNITASGAANTSIQLNGTGVKTLSNISIGNAGTGLFLAQGGTVNATNVDISNTTSGGLVLQSNVSATFDVTSSISGITTGTAVSITGRTGGSLTYGGMVAANGAASGIVIAPPTGTSNVSFTGTVDLGTTTTMTGTAVSINNGGFFASTVSFANIDIVTSNTMGFSVGNGGTVTVTTGTISSATAQAINLNGIAANVNFTSTTSTGGVNNVALTNVTGTVNLGTGSLTGASGTAFLVSGGSANIDYNGSITHTGNAIAVNVLNHTGTAGGASTISFDGTVSSTGSSDGISLTSNGGTNGTNINFTNTLTINTSTDDTTGFNATGGGTVSVTGSGSTIDSGQGTALNVVSTTIGASGLKFQKISSSGGTAAGIVLDTTGALGGLTVTGVSTTATSGGTISGKAGGDILNGSTPGGNTTSGTGGTGIFLRNTQNVSLANMQLNDFSNFAVYGKSVTGFTMTGTTISGVNGDSNTGNIEESAIRFDNLLGSASITGSNISGGAFGNLAVWNTSGTLNRLTMSGNTFGLISSTLGNDNVDFTVYNSATANVTLDNNTFSGTRSDFFEAIANSNATMDVVATNNTFHNGQAIIPGGGTIVSVRGDSIGTAATVTFNIANNIESDGGGNAFDTVGIFVAKGNGGGTFTGKITGNTLVGQTGESPDGIFVRSAGSGSLTTLIQNNTITGWGNVGIHLQNNDGSATMNASVFGNSVTAPGTAFPFAAFFADNGATGTDTSTMNLVLGGAGVQQNTFAGGPNAIVDVSLSNLNASTHFNLSRNGSVAGTAAGVVQDDNVGTPTYDDTGGGGTIVLVNTLPVTPP
ncbi:S-layer family protein [Mesorhizobium sp. M7D.F.Ca.US.005.01.1.1]|uniref:inverse autotransporter beta domain-containing protein n=1 Tax=Mesorhizobium sp. M7D.F.Ca.US.005.01.1.1 TaxID=2493678 RepID=UPI000F759683|nr:inverse autotransporter beta domain-containing protein [Mesorhizobium sp. M7D.F.Ca.US.005.01.1.1]AZO40329.1 S-layer family protein [Mesorhizobium sp. M7D.F.Ca.US.005.01.1.1]